MRVNTSSLIPNQVPEFVRADYPTFVAFVEAYYEFLDSQGVDLKNLKDLDNTIDIFIQYFKKELAVNLPKNIQADERFLLQHLKEQYLSKGSEGSFKLLFRLLFNKNVSVTYPGKQMLRASDGKWQQDISMFVDVQLGTPDLIDGKLVDVVKPNRVFKVLIDRRQYVEVEVDRVVQLSNTVYELFIDRKFFGDIAVGDQIKYKDIFSGTIVATTSKLEVTQAGEGFKVGQLFELKNGNGVRSIVKVTRVGSNGEILSAEFIKFGINYATDFALSVNSTNDFYTSTNDSLLQTVAIVPGGVEITDNMRGMAEQGYINQIDYAYTVDGFGNIEYYTDGTYAGKILREFAVESSSGVQVSTFQDAVFKVTLGALAKYPGYFSANDGFLSDAVFIQDSKYYQAFAYVLKIDERLASYKTAVKTMVHASGNALFGEFEIQNNFDISVELESLVKTLGLSLKDQATVESGDINFHMEKALSDTPLVSELLTFSMSKPLTDSISTPTDALTKLVGKAVTDSISTPTDALTKLVGKALTDAPIATDALTQFVGKAVTDSISTPTDSISSKDITKYLEDTSVGTLSDSGYVSFNPYSSGGYFAITPIYYNDEIVQLF